MRKIARGLSVDVEDLIKEYRENELLSLAREYRKIGNQESRDDVNLWVEFLLQRED